MHPGESYLTFLCLKVSISTWSCCRPITQSSCEGKGAGNTQDSAWIWAVPSSSRFPWGKLSTKRGNWIMEQHNLELQWKKRLKASTGLLGHPSTHFLRFFLSSFCHSGTDSFWATFQDPLQCCEGTEPGLGIKRAEERLYNSVTEGYWAWKMGFPVESQVTMN